MLCRVYSRELMHFKSIRQRVMPNILKVTSRNNVISVCLQLVLLSSYINRNSHNEVHFLYRVITRADCSLNGRTPYSFTIIYLNEAFFST